MSFHQSIGSKPERLWCILTSKPNSKGKGNNLQRTVWSRLHLGLWSLVLIQAYSMCVRYRVAVASPNSMRSRNTYTRSECQELHKRGKFRKLEHRTFTGKCHPKKKFTCDFHTGEENKNQQTERDKIMITANTKTTGRRSSPERKEI